MEIPRQIVLGEPSTPRCDADIVARRVLALGGPARCGCGAAANHYTIAPQDLEWMCEACFRGSMKKNKQSK